MTGSFNDVFSLCNPIVFHFGYFKIKFHYFEERRLDRGILLEPPFESAVREYRVEY
jgi:hypothetical protein